MSKRIKNTCISILMAVTMILSALSPAVSVRAQEEQEGTEVQGMEYKIQAGNQNYPNNASTVKSYLVPLKNEDGSDGGLMSVRYGTAGDNSEYRAVLVRYYDNLCNSDSDTPSDTDPGSDTSSGTESGSGTFSDTESGSGTSSDTDSGSDTDQDSNPVKKELAIPLKLPIFGGFYASEKYYFILSGRNNPNQDKDRAVFSITKYDKEWNQIGEPAELKNCNTTKPFNFGTARMAAYGDYLLVRTSHEMYRTYDGRNHQANLSMLLNMETMQITDSLTGISVSGYVSHSLNQFVQIDEDRMYAVDQGDAFPRGVILAKYAGSASSGRFGGCQRITALPFKGSSYYTNASIGGFEVSDSSCLIAGNSIDQSTTASSSVRNIFVSAVDKNEFKTAEVRWLTSYTEGSSATTPHLVKINDHEYFVLWQRDNSVYGQKIDGKGSPVSAVNDSENEDENVSAPAYILENLSGDLSDCAPVVVSGGSLMIWSANKADKTTYYGTNLETLKTEPVKCFIATRPTDSYPVSEPLNGDLLTADVINGDDSDDGVLGDEAASGSLVSSSGAGYPVNEFFITFHANGGSIYGNSILQTSSWRLPYLPSVSRDGYIFEGWYTAPDGGIRVDSWTQFNQDSQLYARWKEDPTKEYTITFDPNGGVLTGSTVRHTVQHKLTELPAAEREGYTFRGWYTADGMQVTDDYLFSADMTLRAQWQKTEYTITFDANGGMVSGDSRIVTADQKLPYLPDAVRDGYTWNGWYDSPVGGTKISGSEVFQADSTLYARWTAAKVSVKKVTIQTVKSPSSGRLKVSWKRLSAVNGYQVAYSKYKSFPAKKTAVKKVNAAAAAKTCSVKSKGKTYYVRVRAYKKVNGKVYYGSWSSVKKVTVKK